MKHAMTKFLLLMWIFVLISSLHAGNESVIDKELLQTFQYRAIGPARQGGRIVDFAVPESQPYTFYVATATGGLWKTINNGTTFTPIFDDQSVISIGDIAVAASDPQILWVGTGEASNSRSAYWGDGLYKSTDAGKTWNNMGLKESHHIGRIVIHPQNPDIVYVAAMGHLYSFNEERGLYKTTDGGKTWEKSLYVSEKVGVIDVVMDPAHPDTLYAASYDKERYPWHFEHAGSGSAIYKTTDGGKTWRKLEGGLPGGKLGRIGLDIYIKDSNILYATIENANPRPTTKTATKKPASKRRQRSPRIIGGEIYRSEDQGETWVKMNSEKNNIGGQPGYYYGQIRIDPNDDLTIYVLSVILYRSKDGGKTWGERSASDAARQTHSDHHALWIDPKNSDHVLLGNDGGVYITYDGCNTWDFYDNLPLAQYYAIGVDMADPYNVYGGLQDNGSWKGPSNGKSGQITRYDWKSTGGGDGMYNQVDPKNSRWLYNASQFGAIQRVDQWLGRGKSIRPPRQKGAPAFRFNWNAPIVISPHNSQVIYFGGNVVFRSMNQGDDWQVISPDLTLNDPVKIAGQGGIQYCTIVTLSESPISPGIIWAGTDDGKVHVTQNGGGTWTELTQNFVQAGAPEDYWVSRIFASPYDKGTAFVTKTGYRRDDFRPFVYKTTDFGKTWTSISHNLPNESVNVVFQDRKNQNLLFVGTDMAVFVSLDGGATWMRMKNNMPTNPVHDLVIHPRDNDLVVGTHGRGIFIADIAPLQSLNQDVLAQDVFLFPVAPGVNRIAQSSMFDAFSGHRNYTAPNSPNGLVIYYYLKNQVEDAVKITITDAYGKRMRSLDGKKEPGIHQISWAPRRSSRNVQTSDFMVILEIGNKKYTRKATLRALRGQTKLSH